MPTTGFVSWFRYSRPIGHLDLLDVLCDALAMTPPEPNYSVPFFKAYSSARGLSQSRLVTVNA